MQLKRLAIISTHPIQYNAPLFQLLSERKNIAVKVFYTWGQSKEAVYDARFGSVRSWDIPLLNGYEHAFVHNTSKHPDSNHFRGIINPGFIKQLRQENFDAILVYRWSVWSHLRIMQAFGGKTKLFFRGDSQWNGSESRLLSVLKKWTLRFVYRNVDTAFVVGEANRNYFLRCGLSPSKLLLAPHAVDNVRFQKEAAAFEMKAGEARERLQIPPAAIVFLYAGKFYEVKQLPVLIHAFQQLKGDQYRLLLYGSGEQESQLQEMAGSDQRILFQPFKNQSDMPWVYRVGDVFVLPSAHETWGLGVNEAMACGRPAIVSNTCGCASELIVQGKTGFVFQAGHADALLQKMQQFRTKEDVVQKREYVQRHIAAFSLEKIAAVIEDATIQAG